MSTKDNKNPLNSNTGDKKSRLTQELQQELQDLSEQEINTVKKLTDITPTPPDQDFQEKLKSQLLTEHREVASTNNSEQTDENYITKYNDNNRNPFWKMSKNKFTAAAAAVVLATIVAFTQFSPVTEDMADEQESMEESDLMQQEAEQDTEGPEIAQKETEKDTEKYDIKQQEKPATEQREYIDDEIEEEKEEDDDMQLAKQEDVEEQEEKTAVLKDLLNQLPDSISAYEIGKTTIDREQLQENFSEIIAEDQFPLDEQRVKSAVTELLNIYESKHINMSMSLINVEVRGNSNGKEIYEFTIRHRTSGGFTIIKEQFDQLEISSKGEITGKLTELTNKEQLYKEDVKDTDLIKEQIITADLKLTEIKPGYKLTDDKLTPVLYDETHESKYQKTVSLVSQ